MSQVYVNLEVAGLKRESSLWSLSLVVRRTNLFVELRATRYLAAKYCLSSDITSGKPVLPKCEGRVSVLSGMSVGRK